MSAEERIAKVIQGDGIGPLEARAIARAVLAELGWDSAPTVHSLHKNEERRIKGLKRGAYRLIREDTP